MRAQRDFLVGLFQAAVRAADPSVCVPPALPRRPNGRTIIVGAGKASAAMARAVESAWTGPLSGLVITRYGHSVPCERIEIVEAAHPVPDLAGLQASERMLRLLAGLTPDDLVLCLISGGGSALMSLPAPGLTLEDKQSVTSQLLRSGATISEINTVRKHLSAIKGGRLAVAAAPARVVTLVISDVPGDDPAVIASGPTVPDPSTRGDAREVLQRYDIRNPAVAAWLDNPRSETPKPGSAAFRGAEIHFVATPMTSLKAAAATARRAGYTTLILGDSLEGEARVVGTVHAGIARAAVLHGQPIGAPAVILSGGETTVTLRNNAGRGGRNTEFLLSCALALAGQDRVAALACDTDGIDGVGPNAGALCFPDTLARIRHAGHNPADLLSRNDSHAAFEAAGDLVVTGPTLTNVNDFRAMLIGAPGA